MVLKRVDTVENIYRALKTGHHAFPVVNAAGNLIGLVPSNFLIILIICKGYYINPNGEIVKSDLSAP